MNARLCTGLLLGFLIGFAVRYQLPLPDVQAQVQAGWEYKAARFWTNNSVETQKTLKALGDDGWEYVGLLTSGNESISSVAFRRPRARSASAVTREIPVGGD